jgi:hypothetical protein
MEDLGRGEAQGVTDLKNNYIVPRVGVCYGLPTIVFWQIFNRSKDPFLAFARSYKLKVYHRIIF